MRPTWGPPGSCWPQMGPMLVPWTLLWGTSSIWAIDGIQRPQLRWLRASRRPWIIPNEDYLDCNMQHIIVQIWWIFSRCFPSQSEAIMAKICLLRSSWKWKLAVEIFYAVSVTNSSSSLQMPPEVEGFVQQIPQQSIDWAHTTARRDAKHVSAGFGASYTRRLMVFFIIIAA